MGGQDGYGRDLLAYDTDSNTLMAGVTIKPTKQLGFGLSLALADAEAALAPFAIDGGEYVATHPTVNYDFSQTHTYSALDTSRVEAHASVKYKFSDSFKLRLKYHYIDYEDKQPYLYDTSGTLDYFAAALIWKF